MLLENHRAVWTDNARRVTTEVEGEGEGGADLEDAYSVDCSASVMKALPV